MAGSFDTFRARPLAGKARVGRRCVGIGGVIVAPRGRRGSRAFAVTGVTLDSTGAPLGSCVVKLFRVGDDGLAATGVSDGSGTYSLVIADNAGLFYVVSFGPGGTLAGVTLPIVSAS